MRVKQLPTSVSALPVDRAIAEFMLHQRTSRHTPKTLEYYGYSLGKLTDYLTDAGVSDLGQLESGHLREFLLVLEQSGLKPNSVHAVMRAVRALLKFLESEELLERNPMAKVRMPKTDKALMPSFTEPEIRKLMAATDGKDSLSLRNRALVLVLLDSGLRLSECASLKVGDIDMETGTMKVMGKGRKERISRIGATAQRALVKYLRVRDGRPGEPLWLGVRGAMTRNGIAETLEKLGKRAGVHAHPHKFRRTCALFMLRSGADVFSVQYLLGHADLGVLRRYLAQNERDVTEAHSRHSPVDCLG